MNNGAANPEFLLLGLIIEKRKMAEVLRSGVRPAHFGSPQLGKLFKYLYDTYNDPAKKGTIPTEQQVRRRFPWYQPPLLDIGVTAQGTASEVIGLSLQREALLAITEIQTNELITVDAVNEAVAKLRDLASAHQEIAAMALSESAHLAAEWYEAGRNRKITGRPYPYPDLNVETRGMHAGDFILLYGRPKSGKTFSLLEIMIHVLQNDPEARILFVSFEVVAQRIINRLACLLEKLDYGRFNRGELDAQEHLRLERWTAELSASNSIGERLWLDGPAIHKQTRKKTYNLIDVEQRALLLGANVVFIDGLLHASDVRTKQRSREWNVVSNISSDTKAMAISLNCPVVCTHQANRESEFIPATEDTQRDIAYSDALAQDADVALRIVSTTQNQKPIRLFQIPGAREFKMLGFTAHANYCAEMGFIGVVPNKRALRELLSKEAKDPPSAAARTAAKLRSTRRKAPEVIIRNFAPLGSAPREVNGNACHG